ncbi:hypothetical protein J7K50_01550 [bacterium]|nr:hypothetical protein [bacterium]
MSRIGSAWATAVIVFAVLGLLSTLYGALPVHAQDAGQSKDIDAAVEIGAGGTAHLGSINPVTIRIRNENESVPFHGTVRIVCGKMTYVRNVSISAGDSVITELYIDLDPPPNEIHFSLLNTQGKAVVLNKYSLSTAARPEDTLVLVVDDTLGGLSYIEGEPILTRNRSLFEWTHDELRSGIIRVAYIPLARLLDSGAQFLAPVDVLVFHSGDFSRISSENLAWLQAFAMKGGVIVTSAGIDAPKLSQSLLRELLPMKVTSSEPANEFTELARFGEAAIAPGRTAILGVGGSERAGNARMIAGSVTVPIILEREYGMGHVIQINVDYAQPSLRGWPGWKRTWKKLLSGPLSSGPVSGEMLHPGQIAKILQEIPQAEPVPLRLAALFILVYIVLVGPVNYVLLSRSKRRTLLWVSIPVVVIAFSVFAVALGYLSRGTQNILRSLDEVHCFPDIPYALVRNYTMYFTSASGNEKLLIDNGTAEIRSSVPPSLTSRYRYYYRYPSPGEDDSAPGTITYAPEVSIRRRMNKWTPYIAWFEGFVPSDFGTARWKEDSQSVVEYELPVSPMDAWLISEGKEMRLGRIDPEGEVEAVGSYRIVPGTGDRDRTIAARRFDIIKCMQDPPEILGSEFNDRFMFIMNRPLSGLKLGRRYVRDQATLVTMHLPSRPGTSGQPRIRLRVEDFHSDKAGKPGNPSGYYGYRDDTALVTLASEDTVDFVLTVSPVDVQRNYNFQIQVSPASSWQTSEPFQYDVVLSGNNYHQTLGDVKDESLTEIIQGNAIADGELGVTITADSTITITSINLSPVSQKQN